MSLDELKKYSVLYVEDDKATRDSATEYLNRITKEVFSASNGEVALECWQSKHPDIIITDINMPKLNGIQMSKIIRESDSTTPIIIATAHDDKEYLIEAVELQLIKYIIKPITTEKLLNALTLATATFKKSQNIIYQISAECSYNPLEQTVALNKEELKVSNNEKLLLTLLCENRGFTVTYDLIESKIWPYDGMSSDALKSLVRSLRKKLPDSTIKNISMSGYKIEE
ncbi:MAG: response regulator [Helicobacteraceae bacterium]|nr:response regulator [Helicobacteraceae bacterium]